MLDLRPLRFAFAATLLSFISPAIAASTVPDWVPEKYRDFFIRHVDERPAWEKALNNIDVNVGETGRSFALIAGVSRYPNMLGREADLRPARVDVQKLTAYLASEPESFNEIVVLSEENVTVDSLRFFLTKYFPRRLASAPRSRFLFAYSGHGMTTDWGEGFLLNHRARNLTDSFHAGISLDELRIWFGSVVRTGHQVLALINACYGASFHRLSASFGEERSAIPRREGAHAITAGGSDEPTWHDPTFGEGSIFFEAVLAGLDGIADKYDDGVVTVDELQAYLRHKISSFTDERQNPISGDLRPKGSPGGFFFLDRRRQVERHVVRPLDDRWWQSFGSEKTQKQLSKVITDETASKAGETESISTWRKTYGASGNDTASGLVVSADGGYVVVGVAASPRAEDEEWWVPAKVFGWLAKIDDQGRKEWSQTLPDFESSLTDVTTTTDGDFMIAGTVQSKNRLVGLLVKANAKGQVLWIRKFARENASINIEAITKTDDGGFALAGNNYVKSDKLMYEFLLRVDGEGHYLWERSFGGVPVEFVPAAAFSDLVQTADGGFVLVGHRKHRGQSGTYEGIVLKVDSQGLEEWNWTFGEYSHFHAIAQADDGGFVIAGVASSRSKGLLVKVDANGREQWKRVFETSGVENFNTITSTADGGFIVAGDSFETATDGRKDGLIVKLDAQGQEQWRRVFEGRSSESFYDLAQTVDGGYVLAGESSGGTNGGWDGWLVKVNAEGRLEEAPSSSVRAE